MEGQLLGSYRIVRVLGAGAMGTVYEAHKEPEGERVAVKVLRPELLRSAEMTTRFFNEAQALATIGHDGAVAIKDSGYLTEDGAFLVMEYLEGDTLRERVRAVGCLPPAEAQHIAWQLASTLAAAHDKGIIHRDLKPGNVMLVAAPLRPAGERTKLLDFGLVKLLEPGAGEDKALTSTGLLMGTPAYMSPEQCRGASEATGRSDVYSLGVMLYEMLAGRKPFRGEAPGDLIAQHLYATPWPLAEVAPAAPVELIELVQRMMAKKPEARPTMAEVVRELEELGARVYAPPPDLLVAPDDAAPDAHTTPATPPGEAPSPAPVEVAERVSGRMPAARSSGRMPMARSIDRAEAARSIDRAAAARSTQGLERGPARHSGAVRTLPPRRRRGWLAGVLVVVVLALVATGELWWYSTLRTKIKELPTPPPVSEPPRAATIRWRIKTRPSGASVVRTADGKVLGKTPWQQKRLNNPAQVEVELRLPGHYPRLVMLRGSQDEDIDEKLETDLLRARGRGR